MPERRPYNMNMPGAVKRELRAWAARRQHVVPSGYTWIFVVTVDLAMGFISGAAALQRPTSDWPLSLLAIFISFAPWIVFFVFGLAKHEGLALWSAWMIGTAILLFGTSTPITGDFAPVLLGLSVGVVSALTSVRAGLLAATSAAALLIYASLLHRMDNLALYLAFVGIGWLVGHLMRTQQGLILEQRQLQAQLTAHAARDERRRIAREVHDVIAHSLSITLLHLTGARHTLEHDGDDVAAIDALRRAEHLGRQAMADIRHTVGLLETDEATHKPEPWIGDIPTLTSEFADAGLDLDVAVHGDLDQVSAAAGQALYRIAQESLANVAKHAPHSTTSVTLTVTSASARLSVANYFPEGKAAAPPVPGRGMRGMRQRIELLDGAIDVGPTAGGWVVHAMVPLDQVGGCRPTRVGAS